MLTIGLFTLAIAGASWQIITPLSQPKLISVDEPTQGQIGFKYQQYGVLWSAVTDCTRPGWITKTDSNTYQYQEATDESRVNIIQQLCHAEDLD
ncbi:MAG: hypothetical protein RMY64_10780 [Nostoc sp. DedQUE08]|nr:hypothetical protein [Nostoc sp. DedQUE08]